MAGSRLKSLLRCGLLLFGLVCLTVPLDTVCAQTAPAPAAPARLAPAELQQLEDIAAKLEDPASRAQFLKDLRAVIAAQKAVEPEPEEEETFDLPPPSTMGARAIYAISAAIRSLSENIMEGVSIVQDLPVAERWIETQLSRAELRNFWLRLAASMALVMVGGAAAAWVTRRLLTRPTRRLEAGQPARFSGRLVLAASRAVLELLPIAAFALAAYLLLPLAGASDRARYVVLAVVNSHILVRVTLAVARLLLMPSASNLRLLRISDETAVYLYIWVRRLATIVIYGYFLGEVVMLLGAEPAVKDVILKLVGLITLAMLIIFVLQNRKTVSDSLRGPPLADQSAGRSDTLGVIRRRLADVWPVLVVLYLVAFYAIWVFDLGFVFLLRATGLTLGVVLAARLLVVLSGKAVSRAFRVGHDMTLRYPGLESRANRYLPVLGRVLRSVIYIAAALLILQAWGVESLSWLTSPDGVQFIGTALGIVVVLTLALILWEMISLALDRYAARINSTSRSSARMRTLLPLLRTIILAVLTVMVGLVLLSQIGVNITPLLAGAGVIGLAVGFGSQKLVQDVINGLFILAEDTVSVGDVIRIDTVSGAIEDITIRHIRLRDMAGNVITVPFSEVKTIVNMTRDYSRYVFDIGIGYRESVDQVIEVLKELDEGMRGDEKYASLILAPLEIIGLDRFADSAVILKARYTTLPMKQWDVGREFNRRLKKRFDELGIEIPFPSMTIYRAAPPAGRPGGQVAGLPQPDAGEADDDAPSDTTNSSDNPSVAQP